MDPSVPGSLFRQVVVVGLPGLGAGAQPDAGDYGDRGASTLANVSAYMGGLELPTLAWLGLGCVAAVRGLAPASPPAASFARALRVTEGRDPAGALEEAVGAAIRGAGAAGVPIHLVGSIAGVIDAGGASVRHAIGPLDTVFDAVADVIARERHGLVVAVPEPARGLAGAGPVGVARALARLDVTLGAFIDQIADDVLLILVSLGGDDATVATRDGATREYAAALAYTPALPSGVDLGVRASLADVGATAAEVLGAAAGGAGRSFFGELIA